MTFEQWQNSKVFTDISEMTGDEGDVGFVYDGESWIQQLNDGGPHDGQFWTVATNSDILTSSLEEAEVWLWNNWAKDNF